MEGEGTFRKTSREGKLTPEERNAIQEGRATPTIDAALNDDESLAFLAKAIGEMSPEDEKNFERALDLADEYLHTDNNADPESLISKLVLTGIGSAIGAAIVGFITGDTGMAVASTVTIVGSTYLSEKKAARQTEQRKKVMLGRLQTLRTIVAREPISDGA